LSIDQARHHLPLACAPADAANPLTKVSCQRIEVQVQAIAREDRKTLRSQPRTELVDDAMRRVLCPCAEVQDRDELGERIECHPQPEHVGSVAQVGAQFVELEVREVELAEPAVMEYGAVLAGARHPPGNRLLGVAEHRLAAATLSPSASAVSTSPIRCEAVVRR
jgi:hypothetical protein